MTDQLELYHALYAIREALEQQTSRLGLAIETATLGSDNGLSLRRRAALLVLQAFIHAGLTHYKIEFEEAGRIEFIAKRCWAIADEFVRQEAPFFPDGPADHPPRGDLPMGPAR
jgi:hypothetical protein